MEVSELVEEVERLRKQVNLLTAQVHAMRATVGSFAESQIATAARYYCIDSGIDPDTGESF